MSAFRQNHSTLPKYLGRADKNPLLRSTLPLQCWTSHASYQLDIVNRPIAVRACNQRMCLQRRKLSSAKPVLV